MKELKLTGGVITSVGEKAVEKIQHIVKSESIGLWRRLLNEVKASFNAPFESDWEKKAGLQWHDWGKL